MPPLLRSDLFDLTVFEFDGGRATEDRDLDLEARALFVHVLDTALVRVSPEAYNQVVETYKTPIIGLMELGLVAAMLYHALNGVRIILIDFWWKGPRYQRQMLWGVAAIWLVLMVPATVVIGMHMAERFL